DGAAASSAPASTSSITTFMPRSPQRRARPSPMPLPAPVTTAVRPSKFVSMWCDLRVQLAGSGSDLEHFGQVPAHDARDVVVRETLEHLDVAHRIGEPFGMRVVGAEHDTVGAHQAHDALRVLLVERVDPHVALEHLDRILVEEVRVVRVLLLERL